MNDLFRLRLADSVDWLGRVRVAMARAAEEVLIAPLSTTEPEKDRARRAYAARSIGSESEVRRIALLVACSASIPNPAALSETALASAARTAIDALANVEAAQ